MSLHHPETNIMPYQSVPYVEPTGTLGGDSVIRRGTSAGVVLGGAMGYVIASMADADRAFGTCLGMYLGSIVGFGAAMDRVRSRANNGVQESPLEQTVAAATSERT